MLQCFVQGRKINRFEVLPTVEDSRAVLLQLTQRSGLRQRGLGVGLPNEAVENRCAATLPREGRLVACGGAGLPTTARNLRKFLLECCGSLLRR